MDLTPTVIEVFADVTCPFTHVGLRRLAKRRTQLGRGDIVLWVRGWPLERVNGEPIAAAFLAEEVVELRAQVAPDLFAGFEARHFPVSTIPALALTASAYAESFELGERVALALRDAVFERGADIADPKTLEDLAPGLSIDAAGLDRDWQDGQRRGVIGSPHFFVGGHSYFCPSLDISRHDGKLQVRFDEEGFAAFEQACFSRRAGEG